MEESASGGATGKRQKRRQIFKGTSPRIIESVDTAGDAGALEQKKVIMKKHD
jgi:hypothetical protein